MDDAVRLMTAGSFVPMRIAERSKMATYIRASIAVGLVLGLAAGLSCAAAGAPESGSKGDGPSAAQAPTDDSASNADLIGIWLPQPGTKAKVLSVRFGRRDRGQVECTFARETLAGRVEDRCEITRSGNYLTIFARTTAATTASGAPEALFVNLDEGEMVGRMVSGDVQEIRLLRRRSEKDAEDAELLRREVAAQSRVQAAQRDEAAVRQEAEKLARAKIEAEANADLPVTVRIPAGTFVMGFPDGEGGRFEAEATQHKVHVHAFELGKYAVTFAQWDYCVSDGGCAAYRPDDRGWGRGSRPVINVSWDDAQRYLKWLSARTGKAYRLPTEAEWEYAARAGTTTARHWGDKIGSGNANCSGCGSQWDGRETAPVGSFKPNALGLHDMLGNVWQWAEDCYRDTYEGAPDDGTAVSRDADCNLRVARGGAWNVIGPASVRSGYRSRNDRALRFVGVGFRVARSLP
jgi:formylglycine-generating enzyme required for sulfatase activity